VTPLIGPRSGIGNAVGEIVAAFRALEGAPELVPYTLSVRARGQRADVPLDTHFVPLPARSLLWSWARADVPRVDRWLGRARVLHATNYLTPPSRLPTLVSVYDCTFLRFPELCTPEVLALVPIVRRAIARGATVHTGSAFVAAEIEELFGPGLVREGRVVVVPLGVPELGPSARMPEAVAAEVGKHPFVLAISTIEPRKNLTELVRAFGALASDHRELRLVIAGRDGPDRAAVDAAIGRLPDEARRRVLLAGHVDDAGRRGLLEAAAVLAYPSVYEGFGFPVLEAMRAGVPVVAARAGSIPEVAGDAALLVDPADHCELAAAIDRVLTDESTAANLVTRGSEQLERFSWARTARELAACYERLAERG